MSVKHLSSEANEGGMAPLRVSTSFYVAPRDGAPLHRHRLRHIIPEYRR